MTIYYDPDENANFGIPCAGLEALTGGDYLVSPSRLPCGTETLIKAHLKHNAIIVQVKRQLDLYASIGNRLKSSIARMRAVGAKQWQCMLLTTGYHLPMKSGESVLGLVRYNEEGKAYLYFRRQEGSKHAHKTLLKVLTNWTLYGGVLAPTLACDEDIPDFLGTLEHTLMEKDKSPEQEVWPVLPRWMEEDNDSPLQELKPVDDGREVLLGFKGLGPERISAAIEAWGNPGIALAWLSDPELYSKFKQQYPRGIGKATVQNVHDKLGVTLQVKIPPEETF